MATISASPTFGALLRSYRLAAGLTQEGLAERAGISARAVSDLEQGGRRTPRLDTIALLSRALALSPERQAALRAAARPVGSPPPAPAGAHPNNLPLQLTSFIGRGRELADLRRLLPSARLLTLSGVGGCGKTRLALQLAADALDDYADGVWVVDLAPLADPMLVSHAVAAALGVREAAGRPILPTLLNAVGSKQLVIVLDNCEHLLDACARLAHAVLRGCPRVHILATSREPLGIGGEFSRRVPSLAAPDPECLPDLEAMGRYEAVQLFVERAQAVRADFVLTRQNAAATAQVCRRLDGIPLALELAAARLTALTVEQVAVRLDDRFRLLTGGSRTALPRQQTLRAAIDWSYALVTSEERLLFERLSVFAGGWTLEAAEAVCAGDGIDAAAVLELLARLTAQSLVVVEDGADGAARYRQLETLREYGRERLVATGDAERVHGNHASYYLALAEQAAPPFLRGWRRAAGLNRLEREHDNLRGALGWLLQHQAEPAARLCAVLMRLWSTRGYLAEGRAYLQTLLALPEVAGPSEVRAHALNSAAALAYLQGDDSAARSLDEELVALQRRLGDPAGIARALNGLGVVVREQGDYALARSLLEEGLALYRQLGDRDGVAHTLIRLGEADQALGDYALARSRYEECLAIGRGLESAGWAIRLPHHMGSLALDQGDYSAAWKSFVQSLVAGRELGETTWTHSSLADFAGLAAARGEAERAVLQPTERIKFERWLQAARQALRDDEAEQAWAAGQAMTLDDAITYALANDD